MLLSSHGIPVTGWIIEYYSGLLGIGRMGWENSWGDPGIAPGKYSG